MRLDPEPGRSLEPGGCQFECPSIWMLAGSSSSDGRLNKSSRRRAELIVAPTATPGLPLELRKAQRGRLEWTSCGLELLCALLCK